MNPIMIFVLWYSAFTISVVNCIRRPSVYAAILVASIGLGLYAYWTLADLLAEDSE